MFLCVMYMSAVDVCVSKKWCSCMWCTCQLSAAERSVFEGQLLTSGCGAGQCEWAAGVASPSSTPASGPELCTTVEQVRVCPWGDQNRSLSLWWSKQVLVLVVIKTGLCVVIKTGPCPCGDQNRSLSVWWSIQVFVCVAIKTGIFSMWCSKQVFVLVVKTGLCPCGDQNWQWNR